MGIFYFGQSLTDLQVAEIRGAKVEEMVFYMMAQGQVIKKVLKNKIIN